MGQWIDKIFNLLIPIIVNWSIGFVFYKKHMAVISPEYYQQYKKELKTFIFVFILLFLYYISSYVYDIFKHLYWIRSIKDIFAVLLDIIKYSVIFGIFLLHFRFSYLHLFIKKMEWFQVQHDKYYK